MNRLIAGLLILAMMLSMTGCVQNVPQISIPTLSPEPTTDGTIPHKDPTQGTDATDPTATVPAPTVAAPTDPAPSAPKPTEPKPTEPKPTEPKPTEPKPTEPKPTEPKPTEPKPTEPAPTEPEMPDLPEDLIVKVSDYLPEIRQDLRYASENNFTGKVIYDFDEAYLRYGTVKKLKLVYEELAQQGIGLLIWDGFRPLSAQAMLWQVCPDATYVSNPISGNRSHCRGSAIDLTLVDLATGELLEMPSDFDEFSPKGDHDYSDCTEQAAANAKLLRSVMEKHGLKAYSGEWWHYSDTDEYPVEEYFDPTMPTLWRATCNQSMSLRKKPDTKASSLARIYRHEEMELLGWSGHFAYVRFEGKEGYVLSNYIEPVDDDIADRLEILEYTTKYTYDMMMEDVKAMAEKFSDFVVLDSIGMSELGRDMPVLRIGNEDAEYHVLFQAAIHGNEHVTSWLLMALVDYGLHHGMAGYGDICFHIIPMMNPDGLTTVLTRELSELQLQIYKRDKELGYMNFTKTEYAIDWKANALGVDLNRNFDAKWDSVNYKNEPSYMRYGGTEPFSAAEAKALRDYTLKYPFDTTISYHSCGSVIFWEFGSNKEANALSKELGKAVSEVTGYGLEGDDELDAGGYKDWCIEKLSIPSLTIEIGTTRPVNLNREVYSLFYRHYNVLAAVALWVQR